VAPPELLRATCFSTLRTKALLASADPREWLLPAADETVSFEEDIKPLFRPMDHESMAWAFDLASYDEVKENATAILERLRDGSMPCDGEWPE
jgi:hypothetical protein